MPCSSEPLRRPTLRSFACAAAATQRAREAETRCEAMLAQVASLEGARKELEGTLKATRSAAEEQRRGAEAAAAAMKREADAAAKAMEREADAAAKAMSALDAELQEAKATNVILTAQLATARAVEEELAATKRAAAQTAKLHEQAALKLEGTRASTARLEVVLKTKEEEIRALQGDLVKAKERQQELEAAARERADAASAAQEEAHALQLKLRAAERSDTAAKEIAESEAQLREEVHTLKLKLRLAERAKEEAEAVVEQAVGLHRQRELSLEDNDKLKERLAASLARIDDLQLENSVLSDGLRRGRPYALTVREIERRRAAAKAAGTEAAHGRAPAGAGAAEAAAATSHLESDFEDADPAASSGDEAAGGKRQRRRSGRARRKMSVEDDLEARVQDLLLRRRERQLVRKEQQADFKINQPEPDTPVETEVHTDSCTDSEDNLRLAIDPPLRPRPWRAVRYPGMTQALERANQQAGPPDSDSGSDSDPELLPRGRPVLPRPTGAPVHHVPQVKGPDPALRMLPPRRRLSGGRPSSTSQDTGRASSRS
ncbi:unnamed protein product [Pedinophyceae sp. YPF-701]|nr:unnamed protein product [Pedinophyceae sp. YPF-701]